MNVNRSSQTLSPARTFPKSARIMSADHALARTLAEGGNAS